MLTRVWKRDGLSHSCLPYYQRWILCASVKYVQKKTLRVSVSISVRNTMIRWVVYLLWIFEMFHCLMNNPVYPDILNSLLLSILLWKSVSQSVSHPVRQSVCLIFGVGTTLMRKTTGSFRLNWLQMETFEALTAALLKVRILWDASCVSDRAVCDVPNDRVTFNFRFRYPTEKVRVKWSSGRG